VKIRRHTALRQALVTWLGAQSDMIEIMYGLVQNESVQNTSDMNGISKSYSMYALEAISESSTTH
jgi:hypothetical protein